MGKNSGMRIDIMNRNTIISLAMLYALWQSNRQDLLDLIRPFVMYAVGNTTKVILILILGMNPSIPNFLKLFFQ